MSKNKEIGRYSQDAYVREIGTVYYNNTKLSAEAISTVYGVLVDRHKAYTRLSEFDSSTVYHTKDITKMIEEQIKLFAEVKVEMRTTEPDYF